MWAVLQERLRPGDRFVDAGANIGFYALRAAQLVGPRGEVVAIEMMPGTAASLRANVAASGAGNVTVVEKALADVDGQVLEASADPSKLGQASIAAVEGGRRSLRLKVETARLDSLLPEGPVALMKMDLEGAEFDALQGAAGLLGRVDALVYESNGDDPRIERLLKACGFTVRHLAAHDYLAVSDTSR
nr:FkbM family methyltransferase [Sphingomonas kaistensis]